MSRIILAVLLCVGLGGCPPHSRMYKYDTEIVFDVQPSDSSRADHDYVVTIRNLEDIGYDPDDPATRQRMALDAVKGQCPNAHIVEESIFYKYSYFGGEGVREGYQMLVRC